MPRKPTPLDPALYDAVTADVKRKVKTWPSAYASGLVVQEYKRRGGRYAGERTKSAGLGKWFREEWVDLSRPRTGGGYEPCGRPSTDMSLAEYRRTYPKCVPKARAERMSASQVADAIARKRAAERAKPAGQKRPEYVRTNPSSAPRFDASFLLEVGKPTYEYFDPDEALEYDEEQLYYGKRVAWVGAPGVMMHVPAWLVVPMRENIWYPDQLATYYDYITSTPEPVLEAPAARIHFVGRSLIEESQQLEDAGELEPGLRAWEDEADGLPYAVLLDGNHRAFAAILAGEPYIYVYVAENYRADAKAFLE